MTHYKTLAIFQGTTNLPEDRFVNTWHHEKVGQLGVSQEDIDNIHGALATFYDEAAGVPNVSIASRMPASVISNQLEFRTYDMGEPEPRQPHINTVTFGPGGGSPLPTECAVTMSFHGSRSIPRERGRIYIGPLSTSAGTVGAAGKGMIVESAFIDVVVAAASRLVANQVLTEDLFWSVFSNTRKESHPSFSGLTHVEGGWVDNAFDTQRRRGTRASSRDVWGSAVAPS